MVQTTKAITAAPRIKFYRFQDNPFPDDVKGNFRPQDVFSSPDGSTPVSEGDLSAAPPQRPPFWVIFTRAREEQE